MLRFDAASSEASSVFLRISLFLYGSRYNKNFLFIKLGSSRGRQQLTIAQPNELCPRALGFHSILLTQNDCNPF